MALAFLLDENQRGLLWRYLRLHNAKKLLPLDAVSVGDAPDLPLGSDDPTLLLWAEREKRILISADRATLASHLDAHLKNGHTSPGIFLVRAVPLTEIVEFLVLAAYASEPAEWHNRITFIP
ncbi:MAG TPA: hypothetical protein VLJ39_13410 [Tepidisphaeraceae bacterium]|nr:hypothetical protein [Tepidisphaeraceae bacterium]